MEGHDFNFKSKDNLKLHGYKWEIENPIAIICMVHGMGEHIKRYQHVADKFAEKKNVFLGV